MMRFLSQRAFSVFFAAALVWAVGGGPSVAAENKASAAANSGERLGEVERALDEGRKKARQLKRKADTIEQELAVLRRDMVAAASIIQAQERKATRLVGSLAELKAQEDAKLSRLSRQRGQLAGILVALQRVARYPPEALITQPMPPGDTVRSAILLRAVVPQIEQRAARLRDDLESLAKARRGIAEKKSQLSSITTGLEKERQRLAVLFGQKTALKHRMSAKQRAEARRLKSLAGEAATLRELLNKLNKGPRRPKRPAAKTETAEPEEAPAPGSPETSAASLAQPLTQPLATPGTLEKIVGLPAGLTGAPITSQRGKLVLPAVGRIIRRYGQRTKTGLKRKGITFETRPGAQVVAPYEGRVVFADKFRKYGELLIIEHGEGYHSLLSGLARIDSMMGQWVVAGEPVGVMGRPSRQKPRLYVELRRHGQPINPLPWLAAKR